MYKRLYALSLLWVEPITATTYNMVLRSVPD